MKITRISFILCQDEPPLEPRRAHFSIGMTSPTKSPASSRVLSPPLTLAEENQMRQLGRRLLDQAHAECAISTLNVDRYWDFVRATRGHKIFKAKAGAPSDVMISGIVHGKLHDVMTCLYADDSHSFRVHSALLIPKEFIDGEIFHAIDVADDDHPFRFTGLKWCATKWPGSAINRLRDMCYFESTGMVQSMDPVTGQLSMFGYNIMESVDMPQCVPVGNSSIVRTRVSIRRIFRELSIGYTHVMTHCTMDPLDSLSLSLLRRRNLSALPDFLALSHATEVAQSIWFTQRLQCSTEKRKTSFWLQARCALCRSNRTKLEKKSVVESSRDDSHSIRVTKRYLCTMCLTQVPSKPPRIIPRLQLDEIIVLPTDPELVSLTMSQLSSSHSPKYSAEASSRLKRFAALPVLGFDDDDCESFIIAEELGLRSTQNSFVNVRESFKNDEEAQTINPQDDSDSQNHLRVKLSFLAAQMDHTLVLLEQQKTHFDRLTSCERY
ncbi:hypothetical protein AC1031_004493 [Aphanomyces cochlioides]|nr:hypothetical protein AC1031_004493 [Aphanomyces cochlioides]